MHQTHNDVGLVLTCVGALLVSLIRASPLNIAVIIILHCHLEFYTEGFS